MFIQLLKEYHRIVILYYPAVYSKHKKDFNGNIIKRKSRLVAHGIHSKIWD
jgi:hypothetical protein